MPWHSTPWLLTTPTFICNSVFNTCCNIEYVVRRELCICPQGQVFTYRSWALLSNNILEYINQYLVLSGINNLQVIISKHSLISNQPCNKLEMPYSFQRVSCTERVSNSSSLPIQKTLGRLSNHVCYGDIMSCMLYFECLSYCHCFSLVLRIMKIWL